MSWPVRPSCPHRVAALAAGESTYFTGQPCKRGHVARRYTNGRTCIECAAHKNTAHRKANPEAGRVRSRRHFERNREKELERCRKYNAANPEKRSAYARGWRLANVELFREMQAEWKRKNPERVRAIGQNRRARKKNAEGHFTADDIARITKQQNGKCACCQSKKRKLTVDHIQPLSKGGSNWPHNLQMLCGPCNTAKLNRDPVEFMQSKGLLL